MRKLITITLLLTLTLLKANSGFVLLKMDTDPAAAGLAGCEYLKISNRSALQYNPAALSHPKQTLFAAGYSKYLEDGQTGFVSGATDTGYGNIGLDISWLNFGNMDGREKPSEEPQYTFDAGYLNISAGYAYSFFEKLQLGISGKYLIEKIEFESANGYAVSSGIKLVNLPQNSSFSLSVQNIGTMNELHNEATILPASIEAGAGYSYDINDFTLFGAVKSSYLLEDEQNLLNCGLELGYKKQFFVRGGYRFDHEGLPLTLGLGLNYSGFGFDYSFSDFADDFGQIHTLGLSYTL